MDRWTRTRNQHAPAMTRTEGRRSGSTRPNPMQHREAERLAVLVWNQMQMKE